MLHLLVHTGAVIRAGGIDYAGGYVALPPQPGLNPV